MRAVQPSAPWRELSTEHFEVATDLPDREAEHMVRELEEYLAALIQTASTGAVVPAVRLPVVAFATGTELQGYLQSVYNGIYVKGVLDTPIIVTGGDSNTFYDGIARHELAHYVSDLVLGRRLPRWFSEGTACFLETVTYDRERRSILLGRATFSRVHVLKSQGLLPVKDLLASNLDERDKDAVERFYASCWLLVHCLATGQGPALETYQRLLSTGVAPDQAWERAFPGDLRASLDTELASYFSKRRYEMSWQRAWSAPAVNIRSRALPRPEVLATQALVHVAAGMFSDAPPAGWRANARALVAEALRTDPANARALEIQRLLGGESPHDAK